MIISLNYNFNLIFLFKVLFLRIFAGWFSLQYFREVPDAINADDIIAWKLLIDLLL